MAEWLLKQFEVEKVLHPAFQDCPGHEFWLRDYKGSSGVFSIVLKDEFTKNDLRHMVENMKVFRLGYSWGGYESLITLVNPSKIRTVTTWPYEGFVLRLQIGMEDLSDLEKDLNFGFERLRSGRARPALSRL